MHAKQLVSIFYMLKEKNIVLLHDPYPNLFMVKKGLTIANSKFMGGYSWAGAIPWVTSVIKATQKMIHTSACKRNKIFTKLNFTCSYEE